MNMNDIYTIFAMLISAIGILTVVTNIIVQVLKELVPEKVPTNLLVIVVAVLLTVLVFAAWVNYIAFAAVWYHYIAAVIAGIMVAYAAMYGFDKLKEALAQAKNN